MDGAYEVINFLDAGCVKAFFDPGQFNISIETLKHITSKLQVGAHIYDAKWDLGAGVIEFRYNIVLKDGKVIESELKNLFEGGA